MLVRTPRRDAADTPEHGSALIVVLIVMLVLSVGGLAVATIVTNTTVGLSGSRGTAEARAAADAGLAVAVADARRTGSFCGVAATSAVAPIYSVTSTCTADRATFVSTGNGRDGQDTTIEAVYEFSAGEPASGGDMVFFGSTTFTREVLTHTLDEDLLSIVIPSGDFICQASVPANIVLGGDFVSNGGCTIDGSVIAGGEVNMTNGPDTVTGNVTASGPGSSTVRGTVGGDLHTAGGIDFGWENKIVGGDVTSGGSVQLARVRVQGSLTLPIGSSLTKNEGQVLGATHRPVAVAPPEAPTFEEWFDYRFSPADWQPYEAQTYTQIVLTTAGTGTWTCNAFNSWPASGWTALSTLTAPTILDARACSGLSSNSGTSPVVALKANVVLLAKNYNLTTLTIKGAPGIHARVWFVVEDVTDNELPTCAGGAGDIVINGTVISERVTAMAYTPCTVNVAGMGFDSWRGSFYGGKFNYGGGLSFYGDGIALPGMPAGGPVAGTPSGTPSLGAVISQRDVP